MCELNDRDDASIQVDAESGHRKRLDISHDLFGRLGRRSHDVNLCDRAAFGDHAHRIDGLESADGLFEVAVLHRCVPIHVPPFIPTAGPVRVAA